MESVLDALELDEWTLIDEYLPQVIDQGLIGHP
jgi:hypothetical protein